jgi:VanZ family protein
MLLPYRLPRPVRVGLYALAAFILLVICVLPSEDLPKTATGDRVEHTIAWFVLTATGYALAPRRVWEIPVFAIAYGVVLEVLQGVAPTGRHSDVQDFVADVLGVAIATAGFLALRRLASR